MEGQNLLITEHKYAGKYVALKSFSDNDVVASGDEPSLVLEQAIQNGVDSPVLMFIPENNIAQVY